MIDVECVVYLYYVLSLLPKGCYFKQIRKGSHNNNNSITFFYNDQMYDVICFFDFPKDIFFV